MKKPAPSWLRLWNSGLKGAALIASALVAGLMVFLVIARYWLELSVVGLHEIILVFALMLYMTGALLASRARQHLTIDTLEQRLRAPWARRAQRIAVALATTIAALFVTYWTVRMLRWGFMRPQTTPIFQIPLWAPQLLVLMAALGGVLYGLRDLIAAWRARED